ncbi:MAG: calcium-binding protein [Proteobacteria bacterium]|nr:calcium-binding protein [Pseudomonadota bacterium]
MRRTGFLLLALTLSAPLSACTSEHTLHSAAQPVLTDSFDQFDDGSWAEGDVHGAWTTVFDGYGDVFIEDGALVTRPQASLRPEETHAALVATVDHFEDVEVEAVVTTREQLREGSEPNPWETGWVMWNYTTNTSFYYVALKTNGWEIGKGDPSYPGAQRFLADGRDLTFEVGQDVAVRVRQVGSTIALWIDGDFIGSWQDHERPLHEGAVALYNEDAAVAFDDIVVSLVD